MTQEIKTKRRADIDMSYWSLHVTVEPHYEDNSAYDNNMFKSGNYFNSFEDAISVVEKINELLKSRDSTLNIPQKLNYRTAIYTFETLGEVEKEIDSLLKAQPDAQILSVFVDKMGWYRVVERRHYGGFID